MAATQGAGRRRELHGALRARPHLPHADARALRAAALAVDGEQHRRAQDHEFHGLDRSRRRRHDRHLGARSRAHGARRRRAGRAARRPAPAGPHLPADGAAGRGADARGPYRGRLRSRAARGARARRGHRRDLERRRRDGAARRSACASRAATARRSARSPTSSSTGSRTEESVEIDRRDAKSRRSSARSGWCASRITSIARCTSRSCAASSIRASRRWCACIGRTR